MIMAFLYKLYLLLSAFDLVGAEAISQRDQQKCLLLTCKYCSCEAITYQSSALGSRMISWSHLYITCNGLVNFLKFASI